jgi:TonB family protein
MKSSHSIWIRFEIWLDHAAHLFFSFWARHRVGILGTIALNLIVIILLVILELSSRPYLHDPTVLIDFEREYELFPESEPEINEPLLPKDAIDPMSEYEAIKNIAVDATKEDLNPGLTDEKNIDADELYQDAQRLREQLQQNRQLWEDYRENEGVSIPNIKEKVVPQTEERQFKGPAVINYFLENRKAIRLPVPAYKCENGGRVVIDIEVLRDGSVARVSLDGENSVIDECMNSAALEAAKSSRFTVSSNAPTRQQGSITYLFVPQ